MLFKNESVIDRFMKMGHLLRRPCYCYLIIMISVLSKTRSEKDYIMNQTTALHISNMTYTHGSQG